MAKLKSRIILVVLFALFIVWLNTGEHKIKISGSIARAKKDPWLGISRPAGWGVFWNEHRVSGFKDDTTMEQVVEAAENAGLWVLREHTRAHWRGGYVIRVANSWGESVVVTKSKVHVCYMGYQSHTPKRQRIITAFEKFGENLRAYLPDD